MQPSISQFQTEHVIWKEDQWVGCELDKHSFPHTTLEDHHSRQSSTFQPKSFFVSCVSDPSNIFEHRIRKNDQLVIRSGFKSDRMSVSGDPVIFFVDQLGELSFPFRMGVQLNYSFTPSYFLLTSELTLSCWAAGILHEENLSISSWLNRLDFQFPEVE